jgi:hypothetical protein
MVLSNLPRGQNAGKHKVGVANSLMDQEARHFADCSRQVNKGSLPALPPAEMEKNTNSECTTTAWWHTVRVNSVTEHCFGGTPIPSTQANLTQ